MAWTRSIISNRLGNSRRTVWPVSGMQEATRIRRLDGFAQSNTGGRIRSSPDIRAPDRCYSARMPAGRTIEVKPASRVRGRLQVPGDKSIAHRYALLAGLA